MLLLDFQEQLRCIPVTIHLEAVPLIVCPLGEKVYVNGEEEFHLARTRLILQGADAVARRRVPPPLNLVTLVLGIILDAVSEICWWFISVKR